ncbi:hypothetical protein ACFLW9_00050 [Chloroflexota bacterium]
MIKQWKRSAKKRFYLITALLIVLIISGGVYAYTYTTAVGIIPVPQPTGNPATVNATPSQPDWNSVTDNLTENTTCGEVPTGDLFSLTPSPAYTGDIVASVYLTNAASLIKAYQYLNMEVYTAGSESAGETPDYRLLSLQNGQTSFYLSGLSATSDTWTQTTKPDFDGGTLNQVDTATSPGDVILDTFADNVTDTFDDQTRIASSANVTVTSGQVKLTGAGGASDNETLRPNAAGDETNIALQYPATGAHWEKVDDVTSDNYTTYVHTHSKTYQRDLYNIPDHTASGVINNVTVYFNFANSAQAADSTKYAIAYEGDLNDGFLKTVDIATSGNITDTVIDTLEFDPDDCMLPSITHVSGNISAIAYEGDGGDGFLKTVEITSSGNITDTVIDTLEFDATDGHTPNITHVSGNIFAIAYEGPGGDGFLKTVEIATNGQITDTVIDTLEFDTSDGHTPNITHVSGNIFAIAYEGKLGDGFLTTVEIATSGQITDTVIDILEFDTSTGNTPSITPVSGDVYAIAYDGVLGDGFLITVEIATSGLITDTIIDTLEFDTLDGHTPNIIHTSGDMFAIAYEGDASDGFLKTVEIATSGLITDTAIDTLEFDIGSGFTPNIIHLPHAPGNVYARAVIKTNSTVDTGSEESTTSYSFVTQSHQWTNNPGTGSPWTWAEIDALQIGIELKTDSATDTAVCTQVYVEVNYTETDYNSPGTITSVNLLAVEKVTSIDSFYYYASYIPSGTSLKARYSTDNATWYNSTGTLNGWDTLSQGTDNISLSSLSWSGPNFYYHMEFTSDGSDTPILDEIRVYFSTYYSSGDLTSSNHDAGQDLAWSWQNIYFTVSEPATTDVKFQLRTAATEGGLSSATWYGPTGTTDYYQTSGAAINSVHNGDRWIQYKAYFSGPGDYTPTLSDISITYSAPTLSYTVEIIGGGYCLISDNTSEWGSGWTTTPEFYCEITSR